MIPMDPNGLVVLSSVLEARNMIPMDTNGLVCLVFSSGG